MTGAELRAWQHRLGLRTDRAAANMLRISVSSYRRKCKGKAPIAPHFELLVNCLEVVHTPFLRAAEGFAEAVNQIRHLMPEPLPPVIVEKVVATLTKVGVLPTNGGK